MWPCGYCERRFNTTSIGSALQTGGRLGIGQQFFPRLLQGADDRHETAAPENQNLVAFFEGAQAMRDHERGSTAHERFERLDDALLGTDIDGAGRLVQNQYRRVFQKGTRNRQALAFATGEGARSFADWSVIPVRQADDEFMGSGHLGCSYHLGASCLRPREGDIGGDRGGEQHGLLQHDGILLA